ncbi:MAG: ABC transporter permease, partial [Acidobacteriota bacterium]
MSPGDDRRRGPLLGRLLLWRTLPRDRRADVTGDLGELYARRRRRGRVAAWWWYWRQVIDLVGRFAWERRSAPGLSPRRSGSRRGVSALLAWSDLKLAARMTGKTPALTVVAVLAMAVGIGLAVCGFSLVQAVFHAELPLPGGDRIVRLEDYHGSGFAIRSDAQVFERRRRALTAFEQVIGYGVRRVGIAAPGADLQQVVSLAYVTPDMLAMVGIAPLIGPGFRVDDAAPTTSAVVLLGHDLWRALGADDAILGETLLIDGAPHRVVGVMPAGFRFPTGQQAWVPVEPWAADAAGPQRLWTAAKLRAGVDRATAAAEWATVAGREPAQEGYDLAALRPRVVPFTRPANETEAIAVTAAAFFALVLLVIAANVSNLFLARTAGRMNEMAVRVALGGGRGRIIAQLFVEALVVGGFAALLAVAMSRPVLAWFQVHGDMPWWTEFRLDTSVLLLAVAATVTASAVASIPPALKATSRGLEAVLRD